MENWIDKIIKRCSPITSISEDESRLIKILVEKCLEIDEKDVGISLAAAFDLLISAQYFSLISHSNWLYCPAETSRYFLPYTNCCPRHAVANEFFFHASSKPTSGKIGTTTARLLLLFYQEVFRQKGFEERILRGTEPVDAIIINDKEKKVFFAEIKASPLVTLPLSTVSEQLTTERDGEIVPLGHSLGVLSNLYETEFDVFVPQIQMLEWTEKYFGLGTKKDLTDSFFGFRGIANLVERSNEFFDAYLKFWENSLKSYSPKSNQNIYWLTNACGTPTPIPVNWQRRLRGEGFESVSDSKTSVGMDRTDDIKKGIYQVLKLGVEGKLSGSNWDYKVGIISNIHPARHFDDYLKSLKDVVWTNDATGNAKFVGDLPDEQPIYNLFDAIVALTQTFARDEWLEKLFSYLKK